MKFRHIFVIALMAIVAFGCKDDWTFPGDNGFVSKEDPGDGDTPTDWPDKGAIVKSVIFEAGTDNHIYFRIPSMTITKKGTLLAFCEARNTKADFYEGNESLFPTTPEGLASSKDTGDIDLVVKRSTDGGGTWESMITIVDDRINTCGNPTPVVVEQTGRIILFWCWQRWPATLGSDLVPSITDGHTRRVFMCYSDDDGLTWSVGGTTELGGNESCITELGNGSLMTNMRIASNNVEGGCRAYSLSANGGATWGAFNRSKELIDPGCQGSIVNYMRQGVASNTLLLSNCHHSSSRSNMAISKSIDAGATWTTPCIVWMGRAAYSDIIVNKDGSVCVMYENGDGKYGKPNPNERISFMRIPPSKLKAQLGL